MDTSPGGDYYTSPSSPTSSNRNWTEDMEGGRAGGGGGAGLPVGVAAAGTTISGRHCAGAGARDAGLEPRGSLGVVVSRDARGWKSSPGSRSRSYLVPLRPGRAGSLPGPTSPPPPIRGPSRWVGWDGGGSRSIESLLTVVLLRVHYFPWDLNLVRLQFRGSPVSFSQGPDREDFGLLLLVHRGFSRDSVVSAFP